MGLRAAYARDAASGYSFDADRKSFCALNGTSSKGKLGSSRVEAF